MANSRLCRSHLVRQRPERRGRGCALLFNQEIRRAHLKLGEKEPFEDAFVLWLQVGNWFADLRVNLTTEEVSSGFGGVVWWQSPRLYFEHLINLSGKLASDDIGSIEFTRFGCFERGEWGLAEPDPDQNTGHSSTQEKVPFEEKWLMQQSQQSRVFTLSRRGRLVGLEVQTDRYCIFLFESKAKLFHRAGSNQWRLLYANTPREESWRPTGVRIRPGWHLKEVARCR